MFTLRDIKMKIIQINCCQECPYLYFYDWDICSKKETNDHYAVFIEDIKNIPDWCPLEDMPMKESDLH